MNDKFFEVVAVKGEPPYSTLLVRTAFEKGRIVELNFDEAMPEWNLLSIVRGGGWVDEFEPFDDKTLAKIKHLVDTAKE